MVKKDQYVVWFKEVGKEDGSIVGGKGANLGEMVQAHFPVPNGFIVTSSAYFHFLQANSLSHTIKNHLARVDYNSQNSLDVASSAIKKEILAGILPNDLGLEILKYYHNLGHPLKSAFRDEIVAVRSSATAEDLKDASFAGQQETFLNIQGEHNLLDAVKKVWASLFDARALFYRKENHVDHLKVGVAVPVQKMIESEVSGVMFTIDPVTNDKTKVVIEAVYGLGEFLVQGEVTPDHYEVDKKTNGILQKVVKEQAVMLKKHGLGNKKVKVPKFKLKKQKLTESQIQELAGIGKNIEKHYFFPQDIEWAMQGDKFYIVQTRPVTTTGKNLKLQREKNWEKNQGPRIVSQTPILRGDPASPGIATGPVKIIYSPSDIHSVQLGDILVAQKTNPDYVSAMRKAIAIVTELGGRTSHAAIVSRELGIPSIVGVPYATKFLRTGSVVTVNGTTGELFKGAVYADFREEHNEKGIREKTKTKLYVNLSEPERALEVSKMDVEGVGLLRAEFMLADIGIHPRKIINEGKQKMFTDLLSEKLAIFAEAFYPRPVVYRATDFKTNEYRHLIGGKKYEPVEENPMLGFRGAYRYVKDPEVFEMELTAIQKVKNKFDNLWLMIPFVRTPSELFTIKKILQDRKIYRGEKFKLWLMVETPANIIQLPELIKIGIDGISIGSNDLTMLTIGVDRDNNSVSQLYDERDPAVLWELEHAIKIAHEHKVSSSICGQLPSVYPEFIEKLISWGITSVSVSPDAVGVTRETILKAEKIKKN